MAGDVLRDLGPVFLGSRLKRLGERMQAGAALVISKAGVPVQPAHMPLLAALDGKALAIGQLVEVLGISQPGVTRAVGQLIELGLLRSETGFDQRQRIVSLTEAGTAALVRAKLLIWPQVAEAVEVLCGGRAGAFLDQITELEGSLAAAPLDILAAQAKPQILSLREYTDDLGIHFAEINAEWIEAMFHMEDADRKVLENPRANIIDAGGSILFVEAEGLGIVGTCALLKTGDNSFELTKMGVRAPVRGLKVGEFLLAAMIDRARTLQADPLYLLTNARCRAAIHLYEKHGFRHDAGIMAEHGARYGRCDVAMRYVDGAGTAAAAAAA